MSRAALVALVSFALGAGLSTWLRDERGQDDVAVRLGRLEHAIALLASSKGAHASDALLADASRRARPDAPVQASEPATTQAKEPGSTKNEEHAALALDEAFVVVDAATQRGVWTPNDVLGLRTHLAALDEGGRRDVLSALAGALNEGKLKVTTPFAPW